MSEGLLVVTRRSQLAELWDNSWWRFVVFVASSVLVGALGGLLWSATAPRPTYLVQEDLTAFISERGQAAMIGADASFVLITGIVGVGIGLVGWFVLYRRGWLVIVGSIVAAAAASLMTWRLGLIVGDTGFAQRLASASAGDVVPVDLQLRALAALLVAPFAAITPVMLLAAFWPEPLDEQHLEELEPTQ
ncbi:hypothetical protein GCM10025789_22050 [Tessaracoccus lubricantis]|uniref:ABC transporter permease n=1 Tax=Tessaracoccus lubricantis TaxID=545543 RepID=A0ABP9FKE2_9ACTN